MQAIRGQFEVMHSRQPIPEVIADEASPDDLKQRLKIVQAARDFAVWNVFAAPEFSLDPKTWCYPVAGCVAYRGYFAEDAARKKAQRLQDDGFDVAVGGVAAYSTLGRFSDPVLNTMMRWSDVELVSTIFHELAHQKLYVKGDTEFNESFATAVADIGITRWLDGRDESASAEIFRKNRELRQSMMMLVEESKAKLSELYESELDDDVKRLRKQELLDRNWLAPPLNNARLASLGLYEGRQDAFRTIFRDCSEQIDCFYVEAKKLAELELDERRMRLDALGD
jgi:predicted aminopeptidase